MLEPLNGRHLRQRDDTGSTLVSVLIIMMVLSLGALTLASIVMSTTGMLVDSRGTAQSRAAADAGLADAIVATGVATNPCGVSVSSPSAPKFDVAVTCGGGHVTITSQGQGQDGGFTRTIARYKLDVQSASLEGALVSANGNNLNFSSIQINTANIDGNLILDSGGLDCNNPTKISGDVVIRNSGASINTTCHVLGSLYAKGDVTMNSGGKVDKGVTTLGSFTMDNSTTVVGGDVSAVGTVTINAGTVVGAVTSASTGKSSVFSATVGALDIAGTFSQLQEATVTRSVVAAGAGTSAVAPNTTIGGDLKLGGPISTWDSGPVVTGAKSYSNTTLAAPTVTVPDVLKAGYFTWHDLPYAEAAWAASGFTTLPTPGCDYQNNPSYVAWVNGLTGATIVDARTCTKLNLYAAHFILRTDVTFLVSSAEAQNAVIDSGDGGEHLFNILTIDPVVNAIANCTPSAVGLPTPGTINIPDVKMDLKITGVVYTPCTAHIGISGATTASTWNGQIYASKVTWGGNGNMNLNYRAVELPGLVVDGVAPPSAGVALGPLVDLRDVP